MIKQSDRHENGSKKKPHLEFGTQRMYTQPILFPRLERANVTSTVSSSRCVYWNSARSVRWSLHLVSEVGGAALPATTPRVRRLGVLLAPDAPELGSGSGMKAYVGSGGRKANLAAMRLGHGGQQKRPHSSLTDRPFILHCGDASLERINFTFQKSNRELALNINFSNYEILIRCFVNKLGVKINLQIKPR